MSRTCSPTPSSPPPPSGDSHSPTSSHHSVEEPHHLKIKTVIHSLLESCCAEGPELRQAAAHSLSLVGKHYPLLVLQEWHSEFTRLKQSSRPATPKRRLSSVAPPSTNQSVHRLTGALQPVIAVLIKHKCLDPGDVRHRAILGQIIAIIVEEMLHGNSKELQCDSILVDLAENYMDKVMDVILVHYQPNNTGNGIKPVVVETLASLAYRHPQHTVPFIKAILSTTSHIMKGTKPGDVQLKTEICKGISRFSEAVLDYVSNIQEMPDSSVTVEHYQSEGDALYEQLYSAWLPTTKETKVKLCILEAMASCTPFLSRETLLDKGVVYLSSLIQLYKKMGSNANLEITMCLSGLLAGVTSLSPAALDPVLDPVLNAMFAQVCITPDYTKSGTVKNHHEAIRGFDTLMKYYPEKVVSGLLLKYDGSEEKIKVGSLTVVKHLLNLPTKTLNYRLEDITRAIHNNIGEQNGNVRRLMAQIIVVLGSHGCLAGEQGKDFVDFILKLCSHEDEGVVSELEPLSVLGDNILQLLTNSVDGVETVLWPYLIEYIMRDDFTKAVPALVKSLAVLSRKKQINEDAEFMIEFCNLQYCSGPIPLFSRLIVLASKPQVDKRGMNIIKFLKTFVANIHPALRELWDSRFPLLLHYLEQHDGVENHQWDNWLLDLLADSLTKIGDDDWRCRMASSLVQQMSMYPADSLEKGFSMKAVGVVLHQVNKDKIILDNLSAVFLACLDSGHNEDACAEAFGVTAGTHLKLVLSKLDTLYKSHITKRKSSGFFGFLRDRAGEETQNRCLTIILHSVGQSARHAPPEELLDAAEKLIRDFLYPGLNSCKDAHTIQDAVLVAVSEVSIALHKVLETNSSFTMPMQDELLGCVVAVLQDNLVSLRSKQMALRAVTNIIQLPPVLTQITRCALLKASFNTLFNSFLEADCFKLEDYTMARDLEQKLTSIADSLHILIKELLIQDMEQSTVDEIFTMLETWLRLDQPMSRELSVNILQGALQVYSKNMKLAVGSPTNFTPGPYMIGAMVTRCHDPSVSVRGRAVSCLQLLLRILATYEGVSPETVESSIEQLNTMNARCNNVEMSGKLDQPAISAALAGVLNERIQHHHILTLLDSLADGLLDSQAAGVAGCIAVFEGIVLLRGSEVFQNIPGLSSKLHFKMTMMSMDETSDLMSQVALNVRHLSTHNARGVVTSLLRTELPFDPSARMVWSALAESMKLATEVLDILIDLSSDNPVRQTVHGAMVADPIAVACISAISIMLDTHKMETLCRQEFGKIFSHLVITAAEFSSARYERKKSDTTGQVITISPYIVALEAFRSLFAATNCLVVSHSVTADQIIADVRTLTLLLEKVVKSVVIHASHLLHLIANSMFQYCTGNWPDCVREACTSVLSRIAMEKAGGDVVLLSSVLHVLLKSVSDPSCRVREIVMEGLVGAEHCSPADIDSLAEDVIAAFIHGIEDEKSQEVSLASLKGLSRILPVLPSHYVHNSVDLISLKVRPYIEMSGNEHRAAAITIYSSLAKFAEGSFRPVFLDHCQSLLGPILLHSTCAHEATSTACLKTLETILTAAQEKELAEDISKYSIVKGFEPLMEKISSCSSKEIDGMLQSLVGQCLGYFRCSSPKLRRNAVILLSKVLCKKQGKEEVEEDDELLAGVLGGVLDLLKDPDMEVRKTAALYIGDLVTIRASLPS